MEMHQVRYFLATAETLNFTRAAERCRVSQPALTRAMQALEEELGGPLFHRERANTHLTELGRMMHPHLADMAARAEAAKAAARQFAALDSAPLSVGLMCTIGPTRLIDLFARFRQGHPGVDVTLCDARGQTLAERLAAGELDVAVFGLPGGIEERFHSIELFRERFVIAFAPGHRFAALNAVRVADLDGDRYLSRANCEFAEHAGEILHQRGVVLKRPYRSERDDWIQAMTLAGLGWTFIPETAVTIAGLQTRPLIEPEIWRSVHLVTVRGRPHSPAVGAFVRTAMAWRRTQAGSP